MTRPRFIVPTLALLAAAPVAVNAYEIDMGEGTKMSIEPRLQSRIEFASASDAAGEDYDIWDRTSNGDPRSFNFFVRRARIYFKGTYKENWKWNYTLASDNIGRNDARGNDDTFTRYAWVGYQFKSDDIKHFIQFGLNKHTSSMADIDSSSKSLFPNGRLAAEFAGPRSVGIDYTLTAPVFSLQAGLADEANGDSNDYYFYARVASSFKSDWTLKKRSESYLGKEGFGHQLGLGIDIRSDGTSDKDVTDGTGTKEDDVTVLNIDYLVHWNNLTALVDISSISRGEGEAPGSGKTPPDDTSGLIINIQGGWAIPMENGMIVEPAARLQLVDIDTDNDDEAGVLDREGGDSGTYIDLGINLYLDGHKNKFQAGIQIYSPEEGEGDATAFRLAHQLDF